MIEKILAIYESNKNEGAYEKWKKMTSIHENVSDSSEKAHRIKDKNGTLTLILEHIHHLSNESLDSMYRMWGAILIGSMKIH